MNDQQINEIQSLGSTEEKMEKLLNYLSASNRKIQSLEQQVTELESNRPGTAAGQQPSITRDQDGGMWTRSYQDKVKIPTFGEGST